MLPSVRTILFDRSVFERCVLVIVIAALLVAMVFAIARHVPNYDEYYTFYQANPAFGLREALLGHWLADNHPPLFYGIARAAAWLGDSVESRRSVNLIIALATLMAGVLAVRHEPRVAPISIVFLLFLAAQPSTIFEAANLRSYFLSLCAISLLAVSLTVFWLSSKDPGFSQKFILAIAIFLSFNTHIVTTIVAGAILASFLAGAFVKRRFPLLRLILVLTLTSGTIFLAVSMAQLPFWLKNAQAFKGPVDFGLAVQTVSGVVWGALKANIVISLMGLGGIFFTISELRRKNSSDETEILIIFSLSFVVSILAILAFSWKGIAVDRYLIGLRPLLGIVLVIGFCNVLISLGGKFSIFLIGLAAVFSLVAIPYSVRGAVSHPFWMMPFKMFGRQVDYCPDTAIHQFNLEKEFGLFNGPDAPVVVPMTYQKLAQRTGFQFEPESSRRISARCPTIFVFWGEPKGKTAAETLDLLRARGFPTDRIELYRFASSDYAVSGDLESKVLRNMRRFDRYNKTLVKDN